MFLEKLMGIYFPYVSKLACKAYECFLPITCILCSSRTLSTYNICKDCHQDLPILPNSCPICANFLRMNSINQIDQDLKVVPDNLLCGSCLNTPPPFDLTYALFPYEFPIIQLIIKLKFHSDLSIAQALSELFIQKITETWYKNKFLPDLIIPIPLHAKRLRERGFNQVLEIARPIAKSLKIPLDFVGASRIKHTNAQSGLSKSERKRNMANAFWVKKYYTGLNVAVMDDVITTGQTITEFCRLLKRNGAKNIHVWCCARRS